MESFVCYYRSHYPMSYTKFQHHQNEKEIDLIKSKWDVKDSHCAFLHLGRCSLGTTSKF